MSQTVGPRIEHAEAERLAGRDGDGLRRRFRLGLKHTVDAWQPGWDIRVWLGSTRVHYGDRPLLDLVRSLIFEVSVSRSSSGEFISSAAKSGSAARRSQDTLHSCRSWVRSAAESISSVRMGWSGSAVAASSKAGSGPACGRWWLPRRARRCIPW